MIEVLYKDYGQFDGELHLVHEDYHSWDEIGSYTYLYENANSEHAKLIIPTHAVCWIKPIEAKEEEK